MNPETVAAIKAYRPLLLWLTSLPSESLQVSLPVSTPVWPGPVGPTVEVIEYVVIGRRNDGLIKLARSDVLDQVTRRDV